MTASIKNRSPIRRIFQETQKISMVRLYQNNEINCMSYMTIVKKAKGFTQFERTDRLMTILLE